jgi:DNA-binding MarR family transcriptional regulator
MKDDGEQDLYERFVKLEWLIRRHQLYNLRHFGPMANPHKGQGRILTLLKLKPEMTQKELSSILDIRSQSLGELLVKLERNGYITRKQSDHDRRVLEIKLTDAGMEAANQTELQSDEDRIFGCLNEEERANLNDYFEKIIRHFEKQLDDAFDDDEMRAMLHRDDLMRGGGMPHHGFPFAGRRFEREGFKNRESDWQNGDADDCRKGSDRERMRQNGAHDGSGKRKRTPKDLKKNK